MQRCTVIFDFDGTLALGRGPLDAYATCLGELTNSDLAAACRAAVELFDSGGSGFVDAYDAVRVAALEHGATEDELSQAYLRSREHLATEAAPIQAPDGLEGFMSRLSRVAKCVVATNAPDIGIDRALTVLGIADAVHEVHCSVGKPAGMGPIVAAHTPEGPTLSVGDIWRNDLAPAQNLGAATAFVGVSQPEGQPTMRGSTLADLYEEILNWVAEAHQATSTSGPTSRSSERLI